LVASSAYLEGQAPLELPQDLLQHNCLAFALQPSDAWYFRERRAKSGLPTSVRVMGNLRANDSEVLRAAALDGRGIALLPTWLVGDDIRTGRLQALLPDWEPLIAPGPERAIWAIYPQQKIVPAKVSAFVRFILDRFGDPPYWESP
jgi:DNA-binding transcriptional LysR family regulator